MKKIGRILMLLLSVMLVVGAFTVASVAADSDEDAFEYVSGGSTVYAPKGTSLATVIANADYNTTVKLLADYTLEIEGNSTAFSLDGLNLDLGGKTLTVVQKPNSAGTMQGHIAVGSTGTTVSNGTIYTYASAQKSNLTVAHPPFRLSDGAKLTLTDITSYTGGIAYSYSGKDAKVDVIRGEHHVIVDSETNTGGSFIETRANVAFTASNSTFYLRNGRYLFISASYKQTTGTPLSTFDFTNCKVIAENTSQTTVMQMNECTKVSFTGCDIVGNINPTKAAIDSTHSEPTSDSVILGAGTRVKGSYSDVVAVKTGHTLVDEASTLDVSLAVSSGSFYGKDFSISKNTPLSYDFESVVMNNADLGYAFEYVKDGKTERAEIGTTLAAVIAAADAGSTIRLLQGHSFTSSAQHALISKNLTLDLGGKRLSIATGSAAVFMIDAGVTVTVENGTLVCMSASSENADARAVFRLATGATLNVNNVDTFVGCLAYSFDAQGFTVNVNGGNHNVVSTSAEGCNGFIEARSNIDFNANGADFYVWTNGFYLISLCSNKQSGERESTFTFTDCKLAHLGDGSFVNFANEHTKIEFYNSVILGSLTPQGLHSFDSDAGIGAAKSGYAVMGHNTYIADESYIDSYISLAKGAEYDTSSSETILFAIYNMPSGSLSNGDFKTGAKTTGSADFKVHVVVTERDTYSYTDTSGNTVTATNKTSLQDVINNAKAGTEIKLLANVSVDLSLGVTVEKQLTLNLSGYTLSLYADGAIISQHGGSLTVKDGNIISEKTDALFTVKASSSLMLDGVKCNTGSLVSAESGASVAINNTTVVADTAVTANGAAVNITGSGIVAADAIVSEGNASVTVSTSLIYGNISATSGKVIMGEGTYVSDGYDNDAECGDGIIELDGNTSKSVSFVTFAGDIQRNSYTLSLTSKQYVFTSRYASAAAEGYYMINWYDTVGELIKGGYVKGGTVLTPPEVLVSEQDGWLVEKVTAWSNAVGGEYTEDFTVSETKNYYAARIEKVANITDSMYNLTLTGAVRINFYMPVSLPSGVTNVRVYNSDGVNLWGAQGTLDMKNYYCYVVGTVGGAQLTGARVVTVKFNYDGEEYSQRIYLSPYDYAKTVLADSEKVDTGTNLYTEAAHTLVADMVRYSNNLYKLVGDTDGSAKLNALLDKYGDVCSYLPNDNEFSDLTGGMSSLSSYIEYVTFEVSSYEPRYKFGFKSGSKVVGLELRMDGWLSDSASGEANFGSVTYTHDTEASTYFSGTNYLSAAYTSGISVYNIDKPVTVVLTLSGGSTVKATYSLETYFRFMNATGTLADNCREFLKALRAYGESAAAYRFPSGKIAASGTVDFWSCDHAGTTPASNAARNCTKCGYQLVYYSDFGAVGDGVTDDYIAIAKAHKYANNYPLKRKIVAGEGKYYLGSDYVSYINSGAVGANGDITVATDVDWSGAHIIIDDTAIGVDDVLPNGQRMRDRPIFQLYVSGRTTNVSSYFSGGIKAGATKVNYAPGEPKLLHLTDTSSKNWVRVGQNSSSGNVSISEMILIDEFGNVSSTTPVEWDYTAGSTTVVAYKISDTPITISGLDDDGNIDCVIETLSNHGDQRAYLQYSRNILIQRSNVTVSGIDHYMVETADQQRQTYAGIVNIVNSYNVTVSDSSFDSHMARYITGTTNLLGSYELGATRAVNVSWIRCTEKGFFNDDGSVTFKGLMGTNYCRNMLFDQCFLTSFDAHTGAYNVTLRNSTCEHINFIGGGTVILENMTMYADGKQCAISLRPDYGSIWRGDFIIKNLDIRYSKDSFSYMRLFEATYYDQLFGSYSNGSRFTTAMPTNIYIDGLVITKYGYSVKNGVRSEWDIGTNTIPLYIYYGNVHSLADTSSNTNYYKPTENIYISNSKTSFRFPTGSAFANMNVYINGVKQ